jgi:hypothetical protein
MSTLSKDMQEHMGCLDSGVYIKNNEPVHDLVHRPIMQGTFGTINTGVISTGIPPVPTEVMMFKEVTRDMASLYERKNKDYGNSFTKSYEEFGDTMCAIRLGDKLNRFKQLAIINGKQQVNDESIEDTLIDLANYAIMTVIERRKSICG